MRKYLNTLLFIEIVATTIVLAGGLMFGALSWGFVGFLIAGFMSIIIIAPVVLIYALINLMDRVKILEERLLKRKVLTKKDLNTDIENEDVWENLNNGLQPTYKGKIVEDEEIELCKHCGYQLFKEDKECPFCHEKRNKK
jgi:hypothetical protein